MEQITHSWAQVRQRLRTRDLGQEQVDVQNKLQGSEHKEEKASDHQHLVETRSKVREVLEGQNNNITPNYSEENGIDEEAVLQGRGGASQGRDEVGGLSLLDFGLAGSLSKFHALEQEFEVLDIQL